MSMISVCKLLTATVCLKKKNPLFIVKSIKLCRKQYEQHTIMHFETLGLQGTISSRSAFNTTRCVILQLCFQTGWITLDSKQTVVHTLFKFNFNNAATGKSRHQTTIPQCQSHKQCWDGYF